MDRVYLFKVEFKHRKDFWRKIEILGNQTLSDFDYIIRDAFGHDLVDHLSMFFSGQVWKSERLGEIDPNGDGNGSKIKIKDLCIMIGKTLEYVYDFGDDIQHKVRLEGIFDKKIDTAYPRVISRNKLRYKYCENCKKTRRKTVAMVFCSDCCKC